MLKNESPIRRLAVNQNFAGGTFEPPQAYHPSKTQFLPVSQFRWMAALFIGWAFNGAKLWCIECYTVTLGFRVAGFGSSQQKAFYWQRREWDGADHNLLSVARI